MAKYRITLEASFILPDIKDAESARDSVTKMLRSNSLQERNFEIGLERIQKREKKQELISETKTETTPEIKILKEKKSRSKKVIVEIPREVKVVERRKRGRPRTDPNASA